MWFMDWCVLCRNEIDRDEIGRDEIKKIIYVKILCYFNNIFWVLLSLCSDIIIIIENRLGFYRTTHFCGAYVFSNSCFRNGFPRLQ